MRLLLISLFLAVSAFAACPQHYYDTGSKTLTLDPAWCAGECLVLDNWDCSSDANLDVRVLTVGGDGIRRFSIDPALKSAKDSTLAAKAAIKAARISRIQNINTATAVELRQILKDLIEQLPVDH